MDWFITGTGLLATDLVAIFGLLAVGYEIGYNRAKKIARKSKQKKVQNNKVTFISIDDLKEK